LPQGLKLQKITYDDRNNFVLPDEDIVLAPIPQGRLAHREGKLGLFIGE
jgi:hypothetical protein